MADGEHMHDIVRDALWAGVRNLIVRAHLISCPASAAAAGWLTGLPRVAPVVTHGLQAVVTCETCGKRHRLERTFSRPGTFWLVCHGCEQSLLVEIDEHYLAAVAKA